MTYGDAMECLMDGIITHAPGDIAVYGKTRHFYIDQRTEHKKAPEPDRVKPLGKTFNDYWLYVCPDCGLIHAVHTDITRRKQPIECGCHFHDRRKHSRIFLGIDKKPMKVPVKKILLDISETVTKGGIEA